MTLIITYINQRGIIHASDSNIIEKGAPKERQKTLKIKHINAALTVAGSYQVRGVWMNQWMREFIGKQIQQSKNLGDFANNLRNELQKQMLPKEKEKGSIIHISGYVEENSKSHLEFWHVRNTTKIDPQTGEYTIGNDFLCGEEFWGNGSQEFYNKIESFQGGNYQIYINGFAPGRIGFNILQIYMADYLKLLWSTEGLKFRPPKTLEEDKLLIELYFQTIGTLFKLSDYPPYIGGKTQKYHIPQPLNFVTNKPN